MATTMTPPKVTRQHRRTILTSLLPKKLVRARPLFDPEIVRRATAASFAKLNPVTLLKNPVMFVVEVGAAITTVFLIRDIFTGGAAHRLPGSNRDLAVVHCPVRQLRRSHGGSPRQGPGRRSAQNQDRCGRQERFARMAEVGTVPGSSASSRRHRDLRCRGSDSRATAK